MSMWEKAKTTSKAKVVGSALVAVFEVSNPPIVWQFDLEKNANVTFSVAAQGEGWSLGVTTYPAGFQPIVHFDDVASADEALGVVCKALSDRTIGKKPRGCVFLSLLFLGAFLLGGVVSFFGPLVIGIMGGGYPELAEPQQVAAPSETLQEAPKEIPVGVPVDANEFLKAPSSETEGK